MSPTRETPLDAQRRDPRPFEAVQRELEADHARAELSLRATDVVGALSNSEALALKTSPSDFEVFLRLAERAAERGGDALAAARVRGVAAKKRILEDAGGTLDTSDAARLLEISPAAVHKRLSKQQLLAVPRGGKRLGYPLVQFEGDEVVAGLPAILQTLHRKRLDGWAQLRFLLGRNSRLADARPIDALREGRQEAVLQAAESFGEHGAS